MTEKKPDFDQELGLISDLENSYFDLHATLANLVKNINAEEQERIEDQLVVGINQ